ncbi:nucleotidyltransferase substrate binding protein [Vibrio sp. JC009]|uniref:HI0074 family nucleotidyltransferase substrate-binding subunit n=1 Tax=Vibrio sp. JC009 TaxID=2912314 RepID=UPI0023B0BF09|nr:HI0074 family nucleotidyltransferase substrate-binding subunit [Vibrio sp. JC009]WED22042.1 nucleotidyltransferase substrate binding protein [Vibrio sp. JC009]
MTTNPLRWKQRFENLQKAHKRLVKACSQESYSELELAGLIQTFEFSFELTWKTLKDLVEYEGYDAASPRGTIRTAMEAAHISPEQCETLLEALNKRNLLTHTYDEENALEAQALIVETFEPAISEIVAYLTEKSQDD